MTKYNMITAKQFIKEIDEEGQEWSDDTEVMASYFEEYAKLYHESEVSKLNKTLLVFANELNEVSGFPLNSEGFEELINDFLSKRG